MFFYLVSVCTCVCLKWSRYVPVLGFRPNKFMRRCKPPLCNASSTIRNSAPNGKIRLTELSQTYNKNETGTRSTGLKQNKSPTKIKYKKRVPKKQDNKSASPNRSSGLKRPSKISAKQLLIGKTIPHPGLGPLNFFDLQGRTA